MVILRGNAAGEGTYPDEQGKKIAWPQGALHVAAATEYARCKGYVARVIDIGGYPQGPDSPQAKAALEAFHKDATVTAFYGFSGGGYNVWHILQYLARKEPKTLKRIDLIVVLGAPKRKKPAFEASVYNAIARTSDATWDVEWRDDPKVDELPSGLPAGTKPHMFGPEVLLAQTKCVDSTQAK